MEAKRMIRDNMSSGDWDFDILTANFPEDMLKDVGFDLEDFSQTILEETEKDIQFYKKVHVLLSFAPDKLLEIQAILEKIKNIPDVEYEQSAN